MNNFFKKIITIKPTFIFTLIFSLISAFSFAQAPVNDDISNAIELFPSTTCNYTTYTTVKATSNAAMSDSISKVVNRLPLTKSSFKMQFTCKNDVWFKVVVPANGTLIIDTKKGTISNFFTNMSVYTGGPTYSSLALNWACKVKNADSTLNYMPIICRNDFTPGSTLWIRIGTEFGTTGTFGICVTSPNLPTTSPNAIAKDSCNGAPQVCKLNGYSGTSKGYVKTERTAWQSLVDTLKNSFGASLDNDSYIKVTAAATSVTINIWMTSAQAGTGIQIFLLSTPNGQCNESPVTICKSYWSPIRVHHGSQSKTFTGLTIGKTYYLIVDGAYSDECDFIISLPPDGGGLAFSPVITTPFTNICEGSTINLTCSGAAAPYDWSNTPLPFKNELNSLNTQTTQATLTGSGIHKFVVSAASLALTCNTDPDTIEITVSPSFTIDAIPSPASLCNKTTYPSMSVNPTGGIWSINDTTFARINPITGSITSKTQGTVNAIYTVTNVCTAIQTSDPITILPDVTFTITKTLPDDCVSPNGKITFSNLLASTNYSCLYKLNGTLIASPLNFTTDLNGSYEITNLNNGVYTNFIVTLVSNGCSGSDAGSYNLTYSPITFTATGIDSPTCASPQGKIIISGLKPNISGYSLTYNNSGNKILTTTALGNDSIINLSPGNYNNFSITLSNCFGSIGTQIVIKNPDTPIVQLRDTLICTGQSVTIKAKVSDPSVGVFTWKEFATNVTDSIVVKPIQDTTYTLTSYSLFDCPSISHQSFVKVYETPKPSFTTNVTEECEKVKVNFANTSSPNGLTGFWDFGDGTIINSIAPTMSHIYLTTGLKDVKLVLATPACKDSVTHIGIINIKPNSSAIINADKLSTIVTDSKITFTNSSTNSTNYIWNFGDDNFSTDSNKIVAHTYLENPGKYTVTLYASTLGQCPDSTTLTIKLTEDLIYYIPNSFTPNNDKMNDSFTPVFSSGYDASSYNFTIFNKWGQIVFKSNNALIGWDGKINGVIASNDMYNWVIEFRDSETQLPHIERGTTTLMR